MRTLSFDFDEIKIYDDEVDDFGIIKEIINTRDQEDAFYIFDIGNVIMKHETWLSKMPRVEPHYAVKCNPDPTVIKIMVALGASFDCASKFEIEQVMSFGVLGEKIIFANTAKPYSSIKFARDVGVDKLVVDNEAELWKIKNLFPEAKIVIRFRCDAKISELPFGIKFGCDPEKDAPDLIRVTKDLGLELHGFSFHVGCNCGEIAAYSRAIDICKNLIEVAKSTGCMGVKMIDIGGGFPGDVGRTIDEFAEVINRSLEAIDPSIRVISEPGQYFTASAGTSATLVHSMRTVIENNKKRHMYWINDGVCCSYFEELVNRKSRKPVCLKEPTSDETYSTTIWGQTCDSVDCVVKDILMPELNIGDWLIWRNMGAYTRAKASTFNGFPLPVVYPYIRKSAWEIACNNLGLANGMGSTKQI